MTKEFASLLTQIAQIMVKIVLTKRKDIARKSLQHETSET